jgi:hypothetical protein
MFLTSNHSQPYFISNFQTREGPFWTESNLEDFFLIFLNIFKRPTCHNPLPPQSPLPAGPHPPLRYLCCMAAARARRCRVGCSVPPAGRAPGPPSPSLCASLPLYDKLERCTMCSCIWMVSPAWYRLAFFSSVSMWYDLY